MSVSIVIPTLNEESVIENAVHRAWTAGAWQVIVSDGGSTDSTLGKLRSLRCEVVHAPMGRGPQLNAGSQVSRGDWLLFLHADNWLAEDACQQLIGVGSDPQVQFGCFEQRIQCVGRVYRWIEKGNAARVRWRGLIYGDQAMFIRREVFEEVSGFPDLPIMEDLELSRLLKRFGKPLILEGPTYVGARRWQQSGVIRQTLKNWFLSSAYLLGASPTWLARQYGYHQSD